MNGRRGEIAFLMPGAVIGLEELSKADCVIGVALDGTGRILKNREGPEGDLTAEAVSWLKANPMNRPEDWREGEA